MNKKIMFDTNAYDIIVSRKGCFDKIIESKEMGFEYYTTPSQIRELNEIKDGDKRFKIFLFMCELGPRINRVTAVVGYAFVGYSTIGEVGLFDELLNYSKNNINDSLIAESSFVEGAVLVTEDKRLLKKAEQKNIAVKKFDEFYSELH